MKPSVLIVDPSLRSADGHHLGVLQGIRATLARQGLESTSLVSQYASDRLSRDANLLPTFERSIYYRSLWTREEFEETAQKFCADLRKATRALHLWPDMLICPAADQTIALGLAKFLKQHRFRKTPEILLWLVMEPNFKRPMDDPSVEPILAEYTEAFRALRAVASGDERLHVCCETNRMSGLYGPRIGLKVGTVIIHASVEQPRPRRRRAPGAPINIVCAGNANVAKGYALLPDAIETLTRTRGDLRFLVHGTVEQTDNPAGAEILRRIAGLGANVTVRTDVLAPEDYLAWLSQADLLLLPYDPAVYKTCISGVFNEATRLGIPGIVTKDCDFARQAIADGRAVGIEEFDAAHVAKAVLLAADRLEEMTGRAADYAASCQLDRTLESLIAKTAASAVGRVSWFDRMLRRTN